MIRSNSKEAIKKIRKYILDNFDPEVYEEYSHIDTEAPEAWEQVKEAIKETVYNEKIKHDKRRLSKQAYFTEWAAGLPSLLATCYFINRSAVDDLAAILEETEEEKNRFTEEQAEEKITWLMFREIYKIERSGNNDSIRQLYFY